TSVTWADELAGISCPGLLFTWKKGAKYSSSLLHKPWAIWYCEQVALSMPKRVILFTFVAVGIVSGANLALVVLSTSPYDAGQGVLWSFFLSFFAATAIALGMLWYGLRRFLNRNRRSVFSLVSCMRQAA